MRNYVSVVRFIKELGKKMSGARGTEQPFTVIVEGNIGSGKTTFLNYFQQNKNVCLLSEPVDIWRNCNGNNLFGLLYKDPKRWAFTFQSYVMLTMLQQHTLKTEMPIKLMERSLYSVRYCFVDNMLREGIMPAPSAEVLDEQFKWLLGNTDIGVDLIVYLRSHPEVVYERMMKRNREEEKTVSLEYLKQLHQVHENWLYHKNAYSCPAPVLVLDANLNKTDIIQEYIKSEEHIFKKSLVSA